MNIAIVTSTLEVYSNYEFNSLLNKQKFQSDVDKANSFNFFDHDNLFLRKLHLLLYKKKINIDHYKNYKNVNDIDIYYFLGFTKYHPKIINKIPRDKIKIMHVNEPPAVNEIMHKNKTYEKFDYIFTSNKTIVDNKKFFYVNGVTTVSKKNKRIKEKKIFFASFILANRPLFHPTSNYEKKIEIINWFEKNHPDKLHLFGAQWDQYKIVGNGKFSQKIKKIGNGFILNNLNRLIFQFYKISILKTLIKKDLKIYKGLVKNKIQEVSKYKYDFCIENSTYPGFITARIFHTFLANSVPLYLGPQIINELVPANCFINVNDFKNISELYEFLENMSDKKYNEYLSNISNYLSSKQFKDCCLEYDVHILYKKFKELSK